MKDRGKALEVYNNSSNSNNNKNSDMFGEYENCLSELQCRKHPSASSVGICAQCLKDRLTKLVCSECGEQRLSSCSCSDLSSSNRNSCTVEVGSVGRISFLLENEKNEPALPLQLPLSLSHSHSNSKLSKLIDNTKDEVMLLKRSNSSCVEIKKSNGIWKIGRFFRKKRGKEGCDKAGVNGGGFDAKSEVWVVDNVGVGMNGSRSRSMNSFKGCGIFGSEDGDWGLFSGARSSVSGPRASSVNGGILGLDPERKSGFSEVEPRRSGFSEAEPRKSCFSEGEPRKSGFSSETEPRRSGLFDDSSGSNGSCKVNPATNRRIFSLKESDFTGVDDKGFIDLKFFSSDGNSNTNTNTNKSEFSGAKAVHNSSNTSFSHMGVFTGSKSAFGSMRSVDGGNRSSVGSYIGDGDFSSGSFRMTGSDRGTKKSRKSFRGWKWVFRHHPSPFHSKKKEEELSHVQ